MADDAPRALGRGARARRRRRAGSARATRCGSRSATRCTATTSGPTPTPISAGLGWDVRARQGVHRRGRAAPGQGGGAGARLAAFVMDEKAIPRQGMDDRRRRRGHLRHALADARRAASAWATCRQRSAEPGTGAHDRRAREATRARDRRREAHLQQGGDLSGGRGELPRRPALPRRARLGTHRGRRGDAWDHVVRARTRSASSSTSSRPRWARRSRRTSPTARSSR